MPWTVNHGVGWGGVVIPPCGWAETWDYGSVLTDGERLNEVDTPWRPFPLPSPSPPPAPQYYDMPFWDSDGFVYGEVGDVCCAFREAPDPCGSLLEADEWSVSWNGSTSVGITEIGFGTNAATRGLSYEMAVFQRWTTFVYQNTLSLHAAAGGPQLFSMTVGENGSNPLTTDLVFSMPGSTDSGLGEPYPLASLPFVAIVLNGTGSLVAQITLSVHERA